MKTGTVTWFNARKGYGFLKPDDGGFNVYVHISAVERAGMMDLKVGQSEAELTGLKALLAEVKANRDDLRQDRDDWRGRAERLLAGPQRQPWWRRLVG
jgi:cold shock CspA family protein